MSKTAAALGVSPIGAIVVRFVLSSMVLPLVPAAAQQAPGVAATMQKLSGVWVEGPGYDVKYGVSYDTCAKRCLDQAQCHMLEYYRPKNKCNLYDGIRPTIAGGASDVAVKK